MDGLAAIGQRIAEIRSVVADPTLAVSATTAAGTSSAASSAFAAALAQALAADGTTGDTSGLGTGTVATNGLLGLSGSSGGSGLSLSSLLGALGLSGSSSGASLLSSLGLTGVPGVSSVSSGGTTSTALTASGVPADLAAYGNGRIPASALEPVGTTGASMWAPAAESLDRLIAAAKADGVTIGVTEGYRSYDEQVSLATAKGLYSQGGLAAQPGTSEHGWGMAADLRLDPAGLAWMRENAGRFGFVESTPRESWHWSYRPAPS